MATVREFVRQGYRLINPSNPTQPLHGDDQELAIGVLNQLLNSYAANGLMLTIAKTVTCPISIGQQYVICGPSTYTPTPDITEGRLANLNNAWILLDNVDYPLIQISRDEFLASFRYEPLRGLPRFIMVFPETEIVRIQIYPAPSQEYELFMRGKFQLNPLTANDTMDSLPQYYQRYLLFATFKDVAMYKGRADAWTAKLEDMLMQATDIMVSASEVNLEITGDRASLLNGAYRIRAGI
jgi:hypothetical protein